MVLGKGWVLGLDHGASGLGDLCGRGLRKIERGEGLDLLWARAEWQTIGTGFGGSVTSSR